MRGETGRKAVRRWFEGRAGTLIATAVATIATVAATSAYADVVLDQPLALSDRQPLVQLYNLPAARSGTVLALDQTGARLGFDVANNFASARRGDEAVFLDGESRRIELGATRGLGDGWEIGFTLPWISYSGGSLDSFIERWHDTFGLPDGGRPAYRRNQLHFLYQRAGHNELDFDSAESGVGDLQLNAAYSLVNTTQNAVALALAVNLPTGDAQKLTGAEATSVGLTLAATHYGLFDLPLTVTGNIGALWLDRGDVLGDRQKNAVLFAATEIGWAVADAWRLKVQLNAHSAFYRSELRELGANSAQLLLGGSVRLAPRCWLDIAVGEDIAVDTAPDVTMQVALKVAL
jgi:hypothetical protein